MALRVYHGQPRLHINARIYVRHRYEKSDNAGVVHLPPYSPISRVRRRILEPANLPMLVNIAPTASQFPLNFPRHVPQHLFFLMVTLL